MISVSLRVTVSLGTRTAHPGILRFDAEHAFGCVHCQEKIEASTYLHPEASYRLLDAFAQDHKGCREYEGNLHLARIARKARKNLKRETRVKPRR